MKFIHYLGSLFIFIIGISFFTNFYKQYAYRFTSISKKIEIKLPTKDNLFLLKGDVATIDFLSTLRNLGKITVRFYNFHRDSDDVLEFRLRESDSDEWLYKANYKTDQFLPNEFYQFGFPIIKNSENVNFHIEIESLMGTVDSGISISTVGPQALAVSEFSKKYLLESEDNMLYFAYNKFKDIFGDPPLIIAIYLYIIPSIFYFFLFRENSSGICLSIIVLTFILSGFRFPDVERSFQYFIIPSMWLVYSVKNKLDIKITLLISAMFLLLGISGLLINSNSAESNLAWSYSFFTAGAILTILFEKKIISVKVKFLELIFQITTQARQISINMQPILIFLFTKQKNSKSELVRLLLNLLIFIIVIPISIHTQKNLILLMGEYFDYYQQNSLYHFFKFNGLKLISLYSISLYVGFVIYKYSRLFIPALLAVLILISTFQTSITGKDNNIIGIPYITAVSPTTINESWADVVMSGYNFKNLPFLGKVYIGSLAQNYLVSWTDNKIVFRTDPYLTKSGKLFVITKDGIKSNEIEFNYEFRF